MLVGHPEAARVVDDEGNVPRVGEGDDNMGGIEWQVGNLARTAAPKEAAARRVGLAALLSRRAAEAKKIAEEHAAPARIARAAVERERANDAAAAAARAAAAGKKYVGDEFIYPAKGAPKGGTRLRRQRRGRATVKARKAMKRKTMRRRG